MTLEHAEALFVQRIEEARMHILASLTHATFIKNRKGNPTEAMAGAWSELYDTLEDCHKKLSAATGDAPPCRCNP